MLRQLVACALALLVVGACAPIRQIDGSTDFRQSVESTSSKARVNIRLADPVASVQEAIAGRLPPGDELLWATDQTGRNAEPYVVQRDVLISGSRIARAAVAFAPNNRDPVVNVELDERGTKALADITTRNLNRVLVIVFDDKVISAPTIREPIVGGLLQISGNLTAQSAQNLAAVLNLSGPASCSDAGPEPFLVGQPFVLSDPRSGLTLTLERDSRHMAATNREGKVVWNRDLFSDFNPDELFPLPPESSANRFFREEATKRRNTEIAGLSIDRIEIVPDCELPLIDHGYPPHLRGHYIRAGSGTHIFWLLDAKTGDVHIEQVN